MQRTTQIGALDRLGAGRPRPRSTMPSSRDPRAGSPAERAVATIWSGERPGARGRARASRRSGRCRSGASRSKMRRRARLPCHESRAERVDHQPGSSSRADRHAQACGQAVGAQAAQRSGRAASRNASASARSCPCRLREMDQDEIADARRHLEAELGGQLRGQPGRHSVVVRARLLDMRGVADRGDAGRHRRRRDVERTADAVEHVDDMRRRVAPAEPQRREAVRSSRRCAS